MTHCRILSSKLDAYITAYQGSQINVGEEEKYFKAKVVDNYKETVFSRYSRITAHRNSGCDSTHKIGAYKVQESEGEVILRPNPTKGISANNDSRGTWAKFL